MATKVKKVSGEMKPRTHPTYAEMIKEAILALKERSGSSQIAIAKFIEDKHKVQNLAPNYKKLLLSQLKKLVASGSIVKVKNSFKLGASTKPKKAAEIKPKKAAETKPKKAATLVKAKKVGVKAKKVTPKKAHVAKPKKVVTPVVMKTKAGVKKPKSVKSPVKKVTKKAKK